MNKSLPSINRSLPIALLRAREKIMGPIRHLLVDVGLTEQQWRVLRVVQEAGPIDPTQIAEEACLLLPSLTRILQKLEEKELIVRQRDVTDRRRQVVTLTAAGRTVVNDNIAENLALLEHLRAAFGEDRYEELLDLLNALHELEL